MTAETNLFDMFLKAGDTYTGNICDCCALHYANDEWCGYEAWEHAHNRAPGEHWVSVGEPYFDGDGRCAACGIGGAGDYRPAETMPS